MGVQTLQHHHHPVAKAFHWLVAVLVFFVWPLGFISGMVKSGYTHDFFFWHKALGFTILWLMLVRLCVRFIVATPAKPAGMPAWQSGLATLNQWVMYAALICQPIIGYLLATDHGKTYMWFGLIPVPSLLGNAPGAGPVLSAMHETLAWVILGLFGLHLCGALYHRIVRGDDTLARMT